MCISTILQCMHMCIYMYIVHVQGADKKKLKILDLELDVLLGNLIWCHFCEYGWNRVNIENVLNNAMSLWTIY